MNASEARAITNNSLSSNTLDVLMDGIYKTISAAAVKGESSVFINESSISGSTEQRKAMFDRLVRDGFHVSYVPSGRNETIQKVSW